MVVSHVSAVERRNIKQCDLARRSLDGLRRSLESDTGTLAADQRTVPCGARAPGRRAPEPARPHRRHRSGARRRSQIAPRRSQLLRQTVPRRTGLGGRAVARLRRRPGNPSGHQHRSVSDRSRNRPRRHGRRLRGRRYAASPHGRAQGAPRRVHARSAAQGAADAGGARRRVAHPSFDRHHLRARGARWLAVSGLRARARPDTARRAGTRSAPARAFAADADRAGLGPRRRPRGRHRPSRLQAREHRPLPRRAGEDSRLRPRAAGRQTSRG